VSVRTITRNSSSHVEKRTVRGALRGEKGLSGKKKILTKSRERNWHYRKELGEDERKKNLDNGQGALGVSKRGRRRALAEAVT